MPHNRNEPLPAMTHGEGTAELIAKSRDALLERVQLLKATGALGDSASLDARIRAAASRLALNVSNRGKSASKEAKISFILALGSGFTVQASAALVGVPEQTLRRERKRDPVFLAEWELALEGRTEPVEERLMDIAMTGEKGNMATVRAAHIVLQASNPRHRNRTLTTTTRDADGNARRVVFVDDGLTPD